MFFRRLYSRNSVLFKLTIIVLLLFRYFLQKTLMHFLPCVTFVILKPVKPVFWGTNTVGYLFSFLVLFVLKLNNNIR